MRRSVKRYANRKLYDTTSSRYVSLEDVASFVREGDEVEVMDNESGEDLTAVTLAQIILEDERKKRSPLSLSVLEDLVRNGGDAIASATRQGIEAIGEIRERAEKRVSSLVPEAASPSELIDEVLDQFSTTCKEADIRYETALQIGIVSAEICELARTSDLVVLGKRGVNRNFSTGLLGGVTESVARQCPRPIFAAPLEFVEPGKALLAYDGSQRAGSAMHVAAEVCTLLGLPLDVVTVSLEEGRGEEIAEEARRYLSSYPVATEVRVVEGHAYEVIPDEVDQRGYDLLFMGSHGHGRVLEFVLGSTTEFVLRNVTCPVFLNR